MSVNGWLRISIPLQGLLIISQLLTGLNIDNIPDRTYIIVHVGGGLLLVTLVIIHVIFNADWLRKNYHLRRPRQRGDK